MFNDPVADMLTRVRNCILTKQDRIFMPHSKLKENIARILHNEGRINSYKMLTLDNGRKMLVVELKYFSKEKINAIRGLKRVSTPGKRVYANVKQIPRVWRGMGMAIVSTSEGLFTDRVCRIKNLGGEVLCLIW